MIDGITFIKTFLKYHHFQDLFYLLIWKITITLRITKGRRRECKDGPSFDIQIIFTHQPLPNYTDLCQWKLTCNQVTQSSTTNHTKKKKQWVSITVYAHMHTHKAETHVFLWIHDWEDPNISNNIGNNIVLLLKARKHHTQIKSKVFFTLEKNMYLL